MVGGNRRIVLHDPPKALYYQTPEAIEYYKDYEVALYENGGPEDGEAVPERPKPSKRPALDPLETSSIYDIIQKPHLLKKLSSVPTCFDGNRTEDFDDSRFPLKADDIQIVEGAQWKEIFDDDLMYWQVYTKFVNSSSKRQNDKHSLIHQGIQRTRDYKAKFRVFRNCHIKSFAMYRAFLDSCMEKNVEYLWHGTQSPVEVSQKFDRIFATKGISQYGYGTYFTEDPMYSFADKYSGYTTKYIFLCRVTSGDCRKEDANYLQSNFSSRPLVLPSLKHKGSNADSVKLYGQHNWIHICLNDFQAFPEYILCFERQSSF